MHHFFTLYYVLMFLSEQKEKEHASCGNVADFAKRTDKSVFHWKIHVLSWHEQDFAEDNHSWPSCGEGCSG